MLRSGGFSVIAVGGAVLLSAAITAWWWNSTLSPGRVAEVPPAPVRPAPVNPLVPADSRLVPASEALARRDFETAFDLAETAGEQGAPLPAVLALKAQVFADTGYLDREIETLRQWAKAAPADHQPWVRLFYLYLDLGWRREAKDASDRALRLGPKEPRCLVTRAVLHYRSSDPELGLPAVEAAQRAMPGKPEHAHLRAAILIKSRRYAEAEVEMRRALAQDPAHLENRLALAQALLRLGRAEEAAAQFREAQRRDPGNSEAAYELGALAEKQGNLPEAEQQFRRVAAVEMQYSNVLWRLGRVLMRQGRAEEGQKLVKMFQKMDRATSAYETLLSRLLTQPDDPSLHTRLAKHHREAGELPEAIVELRRVLELKPSDSPARRDLSAALQQQGRLTEARELRASASH